MKKEFVYNILSLTLQFRKCCSREAREGFPKEALCSVMMSLFLTNRCKGKEKQICLCVWVSVRVHLPERENMSTYA